MEVVNRIHKNNQEIPQDASLSDISIIGNPVELLEKMSDISNIDLGSFRRHQQFGRDNKENHTVSPFSPITSPRDNGLLDLTAEERRLTAELRIGQYAEEA